MVRLRSLLIVSATVGRDEMQMAASAGPDALALDLEAAVALDRKAAARETVRLFLQDAGRQPPGPLLFVRVNALASGLIDADLDAVMGGAPDGILLPHVVSGQNVQHLSAKLAVREAENGLPDGATRIVAVAAAAASVFHMGSYAGASHRLAALAWSADDLARAVGAEAARTADGAFTPPCVQVRGLALFGAAAAGVPALDTAYASASDDELARECAAARRDGFEGKLATSIEQLSVINAAFRR